MWVALLTGALLQAAVFAKAPDIIACEAWQLAHGGSRSGCRRWQAAWHALHWCQP
jgi:hypothetical protein